MKMLRVTHAKGFWQKTRGLIGAKKAYPLLLKTHFGIHTFGLSFPIDVLVIDQNSVVVQTKEKLLPSSIFLWNMKYDTLLELPAGTIAKEHIRPGQKIRLDEQST